MIGERHDGIEIVSAATHDTSAQVYTPNPGLRRADAPGKEGLGDGQRGLRQFYRNAKSAEFRRLESTAVLCFQAVTADSNQHHRRLEMRLTSAKSPRTPFLVVAKFPCGNLVFRAPARLYVDFPKTSNATLA